MDSINELNNIFENEESANTSKCQNRTLNFKSSQSCEDDGSTDEPPLIQHLLLDFTPDEEIDNDFAQEKCCKFWDFINSVPEIQRLMVKPDKILPKNLPKPKSTSLITMMGTDEISGEVKPRPKSTLSMLGFIEDKELLFRIFETDMPQSKCSLGSREYKETQNIISSNKKIVSGPCHSCIHGAVLKTCTCKVSPTPLKSMMSAMDDWDSKHPKIILMKYITESQLQVLTSNGCTDVFGTDEWSTNSTMHEDAQAEKFSEFGDSSCGEPLYSQRILLDFTPDEEIDNDYVQKKCCEFWNFINSRPEIQHLMVMPERLQDIQKSDASQGTSEVSMSDMEEKGRPIDFGERTALSMLEFAEEKGLIDRTFEAKIHESHCTMGSREYKELQKGTERKNIQCGPTCACMRTESGVVPALCVCNPPKLSPLKTLVRTMQEWDPKHPKSFEPPSHPPSLQHCVLQRKPMSSNRSN